MSMSRVDPRVRAYGKARIDITRRAKDEQEWQRQWKEPRYPFPFTWGQGWKHSIQYQVDDFAAEVGFIMDVLGLPAYAFSPNYAVFTSPDQAFAFSVTVAPENGEGTPPDTIRIQFMVGDLFSTIEELEQRGVIFEQKPQRSASREDCLYSSCFRTPHGICVDLLGTERTSDQSAADAVLDPAEEEVDDSFEASWQETEIPLLATSMNEPEETAQIGPVETNQSQELEVDDGDPFAGLNLPLMGEISKDPQETPPSDEENKEGTGTGQETGGTNGSRGWSAIQTSPGNLNRRTDPRRRESFPYAGNPRGSNNRGNGELHRSEPGRRNGGARRKNPFDTQDLPPLPDFPSHWSSLKEKENVPVQTDTAPSSEDVPPTDSSKPTEDQQQDGKIKLLPEEGQRDDDEPRYEDLDDEAGKGPEDFYP